MPIGRFAMSQLLAVLAVGLFLGVDAPKDDVKKDQEKLKGTWKAVSVQERGETKGDTEEHRLIFTADGFSLKKGDETLVKGKFKLDSSKKPKEIDFEITEARKDTLQG